jgi:hypothetical protein
MSLSEKLVILEESVKHYNIVCGCSLLIEASYGICELDKLFTKHLV